MEEFDLEKARRELGDSMEYYRSECGPDDGCVEALGVGLAALAEISRLREELKKREWIELSKELPPDDGETLWAFNSEHKEFWALSYGYESYGQPVFIDEVTRDEVRGITHWMRPCPPVTP